MAKRNIILFLLIIVYVYPTNAVEWIRKSAPIMTEWGENINPEHVWEEYPRPQLVRNDWMNLNGIWDFVTGIKDDPYVQQRKYSKKILVPFPVESALSGIMDTNHKNANKNYWYRKTFALPDSYLGKDILLHFGAVDWKCDVYVNGKKAGTHEGGYDPFYFNVTDLLSKSKEQELSVLVYDSQWAGGQPHGKQALNPNGIWYTPVTGIWQTVWIEPVSKVHIEDLRIVPDIDNEMLKLSVESSVANRNLRAIVRILNDQKVISETVFDANTESDIRISNPILWSPSSPFLYDMEIELKDGNVIVDHIKSYFGMRKITLGKDKGKPCVFLNNKPIFQYGVLDQGWWPDGLYTAPCDEALKYDLEQIKKLGFNMVRKHVKTEPARWYHHCDKLGLLVWQDIPNATTNTNRNAWVEENFIREMKNIMNSLKNAPSIITWVVFNEGWGQYDREEYKPFRETYTRKAVQEAILTDRTRIINGASGWFDYEIGDMIDKHIYPAPGVHPNPVNHRASACGEYGGINLKIDNHIWAGSEVNYTTVENSEELTKLFIKYTDMVKLLKMEGLCAAVYTQITDVESEINGLITYDRKVIKLDENQIGRIHDALMDCIDTRYQTILATSRQTGQEWKYCDDVNVSGKWYTEDFDDTSWRLGMGGFGAGNPPNSIIRTPWNTKTIYLRKHFQIDELAKEEIDNLKLMVYYDEGCSVYINGINAANTSGYVQNYVPLDIAQKSKNSLKSGDTNLIAVKCMQTAGGQFIDVGLITETKDKEDVSLREYKMNDICRIIPNPASDTFRLEGNYGKDIKLIDLNGMLVRDYSGDKSPFSLSGILAGTYLLKVAVNNTNQVLKLVKSH